MNYWSANWCSPTVVFFKLGFVLLLHRLINDQMVNLSIIKHNKQLNEHWINIG